MSQEFTQGFGGGNTSTGGATGTTCTETSLYKATDGKVEFIELIEAGSAYPPFPGGKGTNRMYLDCSLENRRRRQTNLHLCQSRRSVQLIRRGNRRSSETSSCLR